MNLKIDIIENRPYEEMRKGFLPNLLDYYKYPEKYAMEPFRIYGNLYYVGDKKVCCHLIDTADGLILFDTGYAHTMHLLIRNIRRLGFEPEDIRIIIHSHGHFDHFGCSQRMKELYGCKIYMGSPDVQRLKTNPESALMNLSPEPYGAIPNTDTEINDGDVITLGNTSIRCVAAPGHTEGVMAFFFDVSDEGMTKRVGYWGGIGFFTIYKEHLAEFGLPYDLPLRLGETINKLSKEYADITIGNHPANNKTVERREYMLKNPSGNPFLDETVWKEQLNVMQKRYDDFMTKGF